MAIIEEIIGSAAVASQTRGFIKVARNVTKTTSVTDAAVAGVKLILIECLPPHIKYPAKCLVFFLQAFVVASSFSILVGAGTQVLEEIL
jgi:hypothetical protein